MGSVLLGLALLTLPEAFGLSFLVPYISQVCRCILAEQDLDASTLSLLLLELRQSDSLVDVAKLGAIDRTQQDRLVHSMTVSL
jgi:hypothetical protein